MRAVAIEEFGGSDKLRGMDLPRPRAAKGEILIRVVAAGVNPVDVKIRQGLLQGAFPHVFPLVPGWDVAGVVEELGEGAARLRKGDRVWAYARKPTIQWGGYAEYIALAERNVALMPTSLLFEEAAAMPLSALTAHQALAKAGLAPGKSLLVHAASGGVGHFAVQLARAVGARVLGTAGPSNQELVLSLGAELAIDYTAEDFRDAVRRRCPGGVDAVLDTVGGDVRRRSFDALAPGGVLVSIVERPAPGETEGRDLRADYIFVEPSGEQLKHLATQVERGKLKPHVSKILPLADAARAHDTIAEGHVRGKLVLAL